MKAMCYLTFDQRGAVRVTKGRPRLRSGQYAVLIRLVVPDEVFTPTLHEVALNIPTQAVVAPVVTIIEPAAAPPSNPQP